ncbi:MAG: polymer-forming cytoskeletal protein [Myxococcales bacterium]|nr:polymer-forming cytoskeletal protein [Myxococcales bacterium]
MDSTTVLGETLVIEGEIEGDETLVIQGTVRGEIRSKRDLVVDGTGLVEATVQTRRLSVRGHMQGDVKASDCVEVEPDGIMVGDIASPRVILADGSKFKGNIDSSQDG